MQLKVDWPVHLGIASFPYNFLLKITVSLISTLWIENRLQGWYGIRLALQKVEKNMNRPLHLNANLDRYFHAKKFESRETVKRLTTFFFNNNSITSFVDTSGGYHIPIKISNYSTYSEIISSYWINFSHDLQYPAKMCIYIKDIRDVLVLW